MLDSEKIKISFGSKIKELRIYKKLSQEQLAELVGLQQRTISRIENGKVFVSSDIIAKFANIFEVSPAIFFLPQINALSKEKEKSIKNIKSLLPVCNEKTINDINNILILLLKGQK